MNSSLLYEVAVGLIPGIGAQHTKQLISYCGSAEKIFTTPKGKLLKIPGVGSILAGAIISQNVLAIAEEEIKKAEKIGAKLLFYTHANYPERLRHFSDAPTLLFSKGNMNVNADKIIGIVGTRQATNYGREVTEKIIDELKNYTPTIISGLAYGIDIHAHKTALSSSLPTIAVMASGIDIIYPSIHRDTALRMQETGGLLTEYYTGTKPDPSFFPARNRIVAGICDALIVVEAAYKGGALITAEIANTYNREVFAVPGNLGNKYNEGCNRLIKSHKAHIYTSAKDLEYILNWDIEKPKKIKQSTLSDNFSTDEKRVAEILFEKDGCTIDELSWISAIPMSQLSSLLLNLEFNGFVKAFPGKIFKLVL